MVNDADWHLVGTTCRTLVVLLPGLGLQHVLDDGLVECGRLHQETAHRSCSIHRILRRQHHWPTDFYLE